MFNNINAFTVIHFFLGLDSPQILPYEDRRFHYFLYFISVLFFCLYLSHFVAYTPILTLLLILSSFLIHLPFYLRACLLYAYMGVFGVHGSKPLNLCTTVIKAWKCGKIGLRSNSRETMKIEILVSVPAGFVPDVVHLNTIISLSKIQI